MDMDLKFKMERIERRLGEISDYIHFIKEDIKKLNIRVLRIENKQKEE